MGFRTDEMVSVQSRSANAKLAPQRRVDYKGRNRNEPCGPIVASTHVAIRETCPSSCKFLDSGCYAQAANYVRRLDRRVSELGATGLDVMREEVAKLDRLWPRGVPQIGARGGVDLRLHVSGDVPNTRGARMLAKAAARWLARGGGAVWTFTHRWKRIPSDAWGPISCLASVERPADALKAIERGYAPAIAVAEHTDRRAWSWGRGRKRLSIVPCPAQTSETTCAQCRLCLSPAMLQRRQGVAFAAHGLQVKKAADGLVTLRRKREK